MSAAPLSPLVLQIDADAAIERIVAGIRRTVLRDLRKKGAVVGISGGIRSAVVTALCARALGPKRTFGLFTPERHSSADTLELARKVAKSRGIDGYVEEITDQLAALGCYRRQDDAVRNAIPDYGPGWKFKVVLPSMVDDDCHRALSIVAISPDGRREMQPLSSQGYLGLVAATNIKQRTRKMIEYYHGDRLNYAVSGTLGKLEYDQGILVKGGDGLADFKPIGHLYKTQVYQLAKHLGVPEEVWQRVPTADACSLWQGQHDLHFSLPYDKMDLCLYAKNHGYGPESVCEALELSEAQVARVFKEIDERRRAARNMRLAPVLFEEDLLSPNENGAGIR